MIIPPWRRNSGPHPPTWQYRCPQRARSIDADVGLADERAVALAVTGLYRRELFWRGGDHLGGEGGEHGARLRGLHDAADLAVEPRDDVARGAGRRVDAEQSIRYFRPRFGKCWRVREKRRARDARHREQAQLTGLDMRDRQARVEREVDLVP